MHTILSDLDAFSPLVPGCPHPPVQVLQEAPADQEDPTTDTINHQKVIQIFIYFKRLKVICLWLIVYMKISKTLFLSCNPECEPRIFVSVSVYVSER